MHYLHYIITYVSTCIYNLSIMMTCIWYRRLFQDSMEMLRQMALFSEDFILSKTRFSSLIFFLIYQKFSCIVFLENCDLLWENGYLMMILVKDTKWKVAYNNWGKQWSFTSGSNLLLLNNATRLMLSRCWKVALAVNMLERLFLVSVCGAKAFNYLWAARLPL